MFASPLHPIFIAAARTLGQYRRQKIQLHTQEAFFFLTHRFSSLPPPVPPANPFLGHPTTDTYSQGRVGNQHFAPGTACVRVRVYVWVVEMWPSVATHPRLQSRAKFDSSALPHVVDLLL